ncbi:hypothetical protein [Candidatus Odyssella acanthamoebae]|uniref:hypothetical protein n=1 Tax=Candidatus Odyssella acanthamoebae TaxID=91604 RepID=UPI0012EC1623|nr:hypothetical protein [Candidatus Paracaedibacter acanthamoebae]
MTHDVEKGLPTWLDSWQHYKPAIIITDFSNHKINQQIINLNKNMPTTHEKKMTFSLTLDHQ